MQNYLNHTCDRPDGQPPVAPVSRVRAATTTGPPFAVAVEVDGAPQLRHRACAGDLRIIAERPVLLRGSDRRCRRCGALVEVAT